MIRACIPAVHGSPHYWDEPHGGPTDAEALAWHRAQHGEPKRALCPFHAPQLGRLARLLGATVERLL